MTARPTPQYELPGKIETLLGAATRMLVAKGERDLVELVVNSRVEVIEATDYDNWDGGITGHTLRLFAPERMFHDRLSRRDAFEKRLCEVIGDVARIPGEYIRTVDILLDLASIPTDWREQSGVLLSPPTLTNATSSDLDRLWKSGTPRIFLSHKSAHKHETRLLKDELILLGAAAFVAHDDIEPTRSWQLEIERALGSMDVLIALVTAGFNESYWTNQEIGVALGRGIPVIPVRIDGDPRGFIGTTQAIPGHERTRRDLAAAIAISMKTHPRLAAELREAVVRQWERTEDYGTASRLMSVLEKTYTEMPTNLIARLEQSFADNDQLHGCSGMPNRFAAFLARVKSTKASK